MNLWRLEWLRLWRTKRWIVLVGVYLFFGFVGPLSARYLNEILARTAQLQEGAVIKLPPPTPADGIAQYVGNIAQLGILVVVVVTAGAFVMKPEMATFLRTRVDGMARLLAPRYVVSVVAATGAFLLGTGAAWYETGVLLGGLPAGGMFAGIGYGVLALLFVVSVVAGVSSRSKNTLGTVLISIVVLLLLPLVGLIRGVAEWVPTSLISAMSDLARDASPGDFTKAAIVTVLLTVGLLWFAVWGHAHREV
ncbi:MAG: hypothetical protein GWP04_02115 [Gammaproteobacteria bacterium]|nr:hypothetical protein [Gammaproteobacteria bacterium]